MLFPQKSIRFASLLLQICPEIFWVRASWPLCVTLTAMPFIVFLLFRFLLHACHYLPYYMFSSLSCLSSVSPSRRYWIWGLFCWLLYLLHQESKQIFSKQCRRRQKRGRRRQKARRGGRNRQRKDCEGHYNSSSSQCENSLYLVYDI